MLGLYNLVFNIRWSLALSSSINSKYRIPATWPLLYSLVTCERYRLCNVPHLLGTPFCQPLRLCFPRSNDLGGFPNSIWTLPRSSEKADQTCIHRASVELQWYRYKNIAYVKKRRFGWLLLCFGAIFISYLFMNYSPTFRWNYFSRIINLDFGYLLFDLACRCMEVDRILFSLL